MTLFTLRFDALGWRSRPMPLAQPIQKHWLSRSGPLTQGLRGLGALELTVLRETIDKPIADERMALALLGAEPVWIREVSMSIDRCAMRCGTQRDGSGELTRSLARHSTTRLKAPG